MAWFDFLDNTASQIFPHLFEFMVDITLAFESLTGDVKDFASQTEVNIDKS